MVWSPHSLNDNARSIHRHSDTQRRLLFRTKHSLPAMGVITIRASLSDSGPRIHILLQLPIQEQLNIHSSDCYTLPLRLHANPDTRRGSRENRALVPDNLWSSDYHKYTNRPVPHDINSGIWTQCFHQLCHNHSRRNSHTLSLLPRHGRTWSPNL